MEVTVTILVDNTTPVPGINGEYGFAALIKTGGKSFLFDTGSAGALYTNAAALGVELDKIEDVIISHGHFDHTGAMNQLIKLGGIKRIYAHPDVFLHRLLLFNNGKTRDIGSRFNRQQVEEAGIEMIFTEEFTSISPAVNLTGMIPRLTDYENTGGNFKMEVEGELLEDNIRDDMSMVIEHPDGLIIISGCAHAGIINTIEYALQMTGQKRLLAFIGGTHLITASAERLDATVAALQKIAPAHLILSHCTGFPASARLFNEFGPIVKKGEAGMVFKF
jgi:7,8-dihydropterin-6-yl-methyl-4-(beta-D-ribofuranosyl)aminobenzene 5'-phosphate synthase